MTKKKKRSSLKNKAWKEFSRYIRIKNSDDNGYCVCVTCGKKDYWKNMQAGHAIGGRNNAVLFKEEIVFPQCPGCNVFLNGNYNKYALFMIDRYGRDKFEGFLELRNKIVKISLNELDEMAKEFKLMAEVEADIRGIEI